jgi:hypothetical protein
LENFTNVFFAFDDIKIRVLIFQGGEMIGLDSDAMSIAGSASSQALSQVQMAVQTKMLRTTMDNQEQKAMEILDALPKQAINPPHLGQNIDFKV